MPISKVCAAAVSVSACRGRFLFMGTCCAPLSPLQTFNTPMLLGQNNLALELDIIFAAVYCLINPVRNRAKGKMSPRRFYRSHSCTGALSFLFPLFL